MASISAKTWAPPSPRIQGRPAAAQRRRALRYDGVGDTGMVRFTTDEFRGKRVVFLVNPETGYHLAYVLYNRRIIGNETPSRVYLPKKMTFSMYLCLKLRKKI